jgi:prepilin-type N-terminal cleavage/methylation domain-containing protein
MIKLSINNKGFTVLETMVAILIASMAIAGASLAARGGIRAGGIAKEEIKAFYLAQEALEYLSNVRNTNEISTLNGSTRDWLYGVASASSDPCYPGKTCVIDPYDSVSPIATCSGACPNMRQHSTDYRMGYTSSWNPTQYKREVTLERTSATEAVVTIRVSWEHSGDTREFKTKSILTNWFTSSLTD